MIKWLRQALKPNRALVGFKISAFYPKRMTYEYIGLFSTLDIDEAFKDGESFILDRYARDGDDSVFSFQLRAEPQYDVIN